MYQATFSSASMTDSEIGSSSIHRNIANVQTRIEEQSRLVEDFLGKTQSSQKDPEAYHLLDSLFSLFKLELNMNNELRNAIISEKKQRRRTELDSTSMYAFFKELSRISGDDICTFEDAVNSYVSIKQKNIGKKKNLVKENKELIEENSILKSKIEALQNKVTRITKQINTDDSDFERITTKLNSTKQTNLKIKTDLNEANSIIENQEKCICCLKKRCGVLNEANEQLKEENSDLKEEIINLQGEKKSAIKDAEMSMKEVTLEKDVLEKENEKLKEEINELKAQISKEKEQIMILNENLSNSEKDKADIINKLNETEATLQKVCNKTLKLKKKNQILKEKITETIEESSNEIIIVKEKSKEKFNKEMDRALSKQKKEYNARILEVETDNESLRTKITELEEEINKYSEDSKSLREIITSTEERNSKIKKIVSEYKQENERLRNIMRQQSAEQSGNEKYITALTRIKTMLKVNSDSPSVIADKVESLISKTNDEESE